MKPYQLWKHLMPLALVIILLAACSDDDPVTPEPPLWREVALALTDGDSRVMAVDFAGDFGMAMALVLPEVPATTGVAHEFFRLLPDGTWLPDGLVKIPAGIVFRDLTLDTTGKAVLAGDQQTGEPNVILDLRTAVPVYRSIFGQGLLTVDGEGGFMVAGGRAPGGDLWTSHAPGVWSFDNLPLSGTNDSGFRDVYIRGDRAVACGYDDGADTLQVILTRTVTSDWEKIQPAGPSTRSFFCIALSDGGTLFVGGIEGAGGSSPKAFLAQRSPDGLWADLILPDPELLHGVMDILIADDGNIYLACMGEGENTQANLIHAGPGGVLKEITPFPGGLLQLGQAAGGEIYAVGFRRGGPDDSDRGVMLVKSP